MGKYVVTAKKLPADLKCREDDGTVGMRPLPDDLIADRGVWDDPDDHPVVESVASRVMRPVKRVVRKAKSKSKRGK
jgi:hypothetical protein